MADKVHLAGYSRLPTGRPSGGLCPFEIDGSLPWRASASTAAGAAELCRQLMGGTKMVVGIWVPSEMKDDVSVLVFNCPNPLERGQLRPLERRTMTAASHLPILKLDESHQSLSADMEFHTGGMERTRD